MRRAAVSIPSNIAEGSAPSSRKDLRHFVLIAKGSTCKQQTQLLLAAQIGYLPEANHRGAELLASQVARLLSGLARSLKPPPPPPTT